MCSWCKVLITALLHRIHFATAVLRVSSLQPVEISDDALDQISKLFANSQQLGSLKLQKTKENIKSAAKCDQACTNGSEERREKCTAKCLTLQGQICPDKFDCHKGCSNNVKQVVQDKECEKLCKDVQASICLPLGFEAPTENFSPHHDNEPPPSVEATPAPRIFQGCFPICNLYPASYEFEVRAMGADGKGEGAKITSLGYKQCAIVTMKSLERIGVSVDGKMSGVSLPIQKIPSVMVFGQWAFKNNQVDFNRYFAKAQGAMVCNGFPLWKSKDIGEPAQLLRGGYDGTKIAMIKYKECVPTALKTGDVLAVQIMGKNAGLYNVIGDPAPKAIVLGKAGESSALAFEAWVGQDEVSLL